MKTQVFSIDVGIWSIKTHFRGKEMNFRSTVTAHEAFEKGLPLPEGCFPIMMPETGNKYVIGYKDERKHADLYFNEEVFDRYIGEIVYQLMKMHGVNFSEPILCMYGTPPTNSLINEEKMKASVMKMTNNHEVSSLRIMTAAVGQGANFALEKEGKKEKILIIEVGHESLNTMLFDGRTPIHNLCTYANIGASYILFRVLEDMREFDYENSEYFLSDAIKCIAEGGKKMSNGLYVLGINMFDIQYDFYWKVFQENYHILDESVLESDKIVVIGGGSRFFDMDAVDKLMKSEKSRKKLREALLLEDDFAMYGNVRGFSYAGEEVLKGNITGRV